MAHDEQDPHDPLPQLRAELDQMLAMAPEMARMYRTLFLAFVGEGFTETQALYLTACQVHSSPGDAPS